MATTISWTAGIATSSVSAENAVTQGGVASQKIQLLTSKATTSGTDTFDEGVVGLLVEGY